MIQQRNNTVPSLCEMMNNSEPSLCEGHDSNDLNNIDWDEIDWHALDVAEEMALQVGEPMATSPICSGKKSRKHLRENRIEDCEEDEQIKFMRFGSLGRIIASSVVASTPPVSSQGRLPYPLTSYPENTEKGEAMKFTAVKFVNAFNLGDLGRLAILVREICDESCHMITPDVYCHDSIIGRADVMMLFSLILETYPDGVYRLLSSTVNNNSVTVTYSFTGTRVFEQSMDALYKQCKLHAAGAAIDETSLSKSNAEGFGGESDLIRISKFSSQNSDSDLIHVSKTTTQNSVVQPDEPHQHPQIYHSSSFDRSQKNNSHGHDMPTLVHLYNSSSVDRLQNTVQQSEMKHIPGQSSIFPQQTPQSFSTLQLLQQRFTDTVTNLIPQVTNLIPHGILVSQALKEGPVKYKRTMELSFNINNQIEQIHISDITQISRQF
jgi:hypothetical protein